MINKNFFLLWIGKIISQLGDKFYALALAWWILQETNSPSIMGLFLLTSILPGVILGLFAGTLTDLWNRKKILIFTDLIRGGLVLIISYLSIISKLEVWHVFCAGFFLSLAASFFDPAIQAVIPEVVDKEDLTKANGLSQMVSGICMVAGPLLGAIAVSFFGIAWVFFANSISYFVSSFLTMFVNISKNKPKIAQKINILHEMKEGISFIKKQGNILLILKIIALAHIFVGSLTVTLPFLAKSLGGNGIKNLGFLEMAMGVGLILGSLFLSIKKKTAINLQRLLSLIFVFSFCFIIIGISQFYSLSTIYTYIPIMIAIGLCVACASISWQSLLQQYTETNIRGRVFSISSLIGNVSLPISNGIFGILLTHTSIPLIMFASGISLLLVCIYLFIQTKQKELSSES